MFLCNFIVTFVAKLTSPMFYTLKEYREKYYPNVCIRTVQRRIVAGNIPSTHHPKTSPHGTFIFVGSELEYKSDEYFNACCEFHRRKHTYNGTHIELAVELSMDFDVGLTRLTKFLGI